MAEIIWGLATSHVPPIGLAMDHGLTQDPYWKPLFDGYAPARKWMAEHTQDGEGPVAGLAGPRDRHRPRGHGHRP